VEAPRLPAVPATFYGAVMGGGDFRPVAGLGVTAWVEGRLCGQGRTLALARQVVYVVDVNAQGQEGYCGALGSRVTFEIDGIPMNLAALWDNNRLWELNLFDSQRLYLPVIRR